MTAPYMLWQVIFVWHKDDDEDGQFSYSTHARTCTYTQSWLMMYIRVDIFAIVINTLRPPPLFVGYVVTCF